MDRALREIARVLRGGGVFIVEDSIVPGDPGLDRFMNELETVRDATHVRSLTLAEWQHKVAAAGMVAEQTAICRKTHDVADWIARAGLDDAGAERVQAAFGRASDAAIACFDIVFSGRRAVSFTDEKVILRARKPEGER